MSTEDRNHAAPLPQGEIANKVPALGEQEQLIGELNLRTPSKEELFDLFDHLKEPISGTLRTYNAAELKAITHSVLQGQAELNMLPRTFGLRSLVGACMQLDQLWKGFQIDTDRIAPPLTLEEFKGLVRNLRDIESTSKKGTFYPSAYLLACIDMLVKPDPSRLTPLELMPRRCGLRSIARGVVSQLPSNS